MRGGFLGEVPASEFITGPDLVARIGLTGGRAEHNEGPWLKFTLDGKMLYVAKNPFRSGIPWDNINAVGAAYGESTIVVANETFKVRLLKGVSSDPTPSLMGYDLTSTWGSEWNRLMYPLVSNPTNRPASGISGEGIRFGSWASYTQVNLTISTSRGGYSWCQETIVDRNGRRVLRGRSGITYLNYGNSNSVDSAYGWRPVLELVE